MSISKQLLGRRLLIDGDVLLYRAAFSAEKTHYLVVGTAEEGGDLCIEFPNHKEARAYAQPLEKPIWSRKEIQPVEHAIQATKTVLEALVNRFEPSDVDVFLSDSPTFRDRLAVTKPYKGGRKERPTHYNDVKDYLLSQGAIIRKDIEADDCMSIEAFKDPENTIVVSIDKDLLQVPGNHFNWVESTYVTQSRKNADFCLASQLLTGDSTDNIPGLPGVGPVAAKAIITGSKSTEDLFGRVFKAYEDKIGKDWEPYFVEQFKLIFLLRNYEQKDSFPEIHKETGFKI